MTPNNTKLVERLTRENAELVEALSAFVNIRDQFPQSVKLIDKALDGLTPVAVTVTKAQFLAAHYALKRARA